MQRLVTGIVTLTLVALGVVAVSRFISTAQAQGGLEFNCQGLPTRAAAEGISSRRALVPGEMQVGCFTENGCGVRS
jgi:hypothetical protein